MGIAVCPASLLSAPGAPVRADSSSARGVVVCAPLRPNRAASGRVAS
jgi:hypothetical protein